MKKVLLLSFVILNLFQNLNSKAQTTTQLLGVTTDAWGSIFKIDPTSLIHSNIINLGSAGQVPYCNLIQANNSKLYGTCYTGGVNGKGTIFCYDPMTNINIDIHNNDSATGQNSNCGLVQGPNGLLYGTTTAGGLHNWGVLYSIDPTSNVYSVLHYFDTVTGINPYVVPIVCNGKLIGMTSYGVSNTSGIYSYDIQTNIYSLIVTFDGTNTGWGSFSNTNIISGNDGKLYGVTQFGGTGGNGTIFSIDTATLSFQKLYDFTLLSGEGPKGPPLMASNGKLYGTTNFGGANSSTGVIYSFDLTSNTYTDLYNFDDSTGNHPEGNLVELSNGLLYGTTHDGGVNHNGIVFSYDISNNIYSDIFDFTSTKGAPKSGLLKLVTTTGISESTLSNNNITISPNPATDKLNITIKDNTFQSAIITITNIIGEKVLQSTIDNHQSTINISELSKGMYFVEANVDGKRSVVKIIKQ